MVTFSSFLPVLILSCTNILVFGKYFTLYINLMSCIFLLSVPAVLVTFFFFLERLQLFVFVFCFEDQVLSPDSNLATDFLGLVPVWRVAQKIFSSPAVCLWMLGGRKPEVNFQSLEDFPKELRGEPGVPVANNRPTEAMQTINIPHIEVSSSSRSH